MPFLCLKTAWSWTKTLVGSINVTLFLCVVALATFHFAVCEDLFGVLYVEAAATCEIISRNAYDARYLVMKQFHDLSKEKSARAHIPGILSILSVVALNCQARCSCISADCQLSRLCTLYLQPRRTPTTGTLTVSLVSSSAYSRLNFLKVGVSFMMTDD